MLNFDCGLYTITAPSGQFYVGSAVSFKKRWAFHRWQLRKGTHHCAPLQRAFSKYGESALAFAKIAFVPVAELLTREQEQIDAANWRKLYNTSRSAIGPMTGRKHNEHTKSEMARLAKERMTPAACAHLGEVRRVRGHKPTAATIERSAALRRGRPLSGAHRDNLSKALIGRAIDPAVGAKIAATKANRKTVSNTSGVVGASLHASGKWKACASIGQRSVYLGLFATLDEAADAIKAALAAAI